MKKESDLKKLRQNQKVLHQQESQKIVDETYNSSTYSQTLARYQKIKKLKWKHWLIVLGITIFGMGMSFLVGYLTINSSSAPDWQGTGWFALPYTVTLAVGYFILGWIRNKKAMKFFNDRRRRYQKTLEDDEAKIQLIRKILFFSFLPMLILTIVVTIVF